MLALCGPVVPVWMLLLLLLVRGGLLVAVVRGHDFFRSSVQLQGCDSGDVFGELRFPPHQWAFSALISLDLDTETEGAVTQALILSAAITHLFGLWTESGLTGYIRLSGSIQTRSHLLFQACFPHT